MTGNSQISLIAITFATAGFAMFSQAASASTAHMQCSAISQSQMLQCCARLENRNSTGCREAEVRFKKKRLVVELIKLSDDGGGNGGNGGRGGRGNGRK